jgi:glycopeptide antibiotics resistance protein
LSRLGPLYAALAIFPLLALSAGLPYVAIQYRRRGTVGAGHLALAGAFGLYLIALAFFVILPLRPVTPDFCDVYGVSAQWNPFHLLNEVRYDRAVGGWHAVLGNADVQQFVLNVFLFIPLGLFVRHLRRRGVAATVAIGFGVSLLIELTQLTGNWGLYPCAYRFFETNDLFTNTLGTAIGAAMAPMLRAVPAQLILERPQDPQPVTPLRRLLAALCDLASILLAGLVLIALAGVVLEATRGQLFDSDSIRAQMLRVTALATPAVALLLVLPLAWGGRTLGEWAVLIRPVSPSGRAPVPALTIGRFLAGPAPLILLTCAGILGSTAAWYVGAGVAIVQIALVIAAPRGEIGARTRSGLVIVDSRQILQKP